MSKSIIGGGGKTICLPPPPKKKKKIFHWGGGGGDCSSAPPGSTPLGASDLDEQGGMCTVADPGFAKKGVGGKIRACSAPCVREARASYGWGPGARRRGPWRGAGAKPLPGAQGGRSPRKLSSFQQIRAFKMVVRSDRKCNFSRCNFAYRALDSMSFSPFFFFFFYICNIYMFT